MKYRESLNYTLEMLESNILLKTDLRAIKPRKDMEEPRD